MFDVTVVIPTRNRWATLEQYGLRAALAQEGLRVEVIVVDDGSDSEPAASSELHRERVRLIRLQSAGGVAAARNAGIAAARAPWVALLDDDDIWAPGRLERMLAVAEAERMSFVHSAALVVDHGLTPQWVVPATPDDEVLRRLLRYNAIPAGGSNVVVRTELLQQVGGFDESFSFATDWELWIRLAHEGRCTSVPDPLIAYVHHPGNWVLSSDPAVHGDVERIAQKHADLMRRHGAAIDWLNYERYIAHSMRMAGRRREATRHYAVAGLRYRHAGTLAQAAVSLVIPPIVMKYRRRRLAPTRPSWLDIYRIRPFGG